MTKIKLTYIIVLTIFVTLFLHNVYLAHVKRVQEKKEVEEFLQSLQECERADNPFNCAWK